MRVRALLRGTLAVATVQLAFTTLAPLLPGIVHAAAIQRMSLPPVLSNAFSAISWLFQLMPEMPTPLLPIAPIAPAMWVPWPRSSSGLLLFLTKFQPIRSST